MGRCVLRGREIRYMLYETVICEETYMSINVWSPIISSETGGQKSELQFKRKWKVLKPVH